MLKKTITAAVLGVSALSMIAANAATPGPYITGQLGYAKSDFFSQLPKLDALHNYTDGLGLNLSNKGLAGRLAAGYQFNQNFAVEAGYLQLGDKKLGFQTVDVPNNPSINFSQHAIDLDVKGILPIACNFNAYAKLGMAYLTTTVKSKSSDTDLDKLSTFAKSKWAPEVALGMAYDITPSVSVDASWTHIHPSKKDNNAWNFSNVNFFALGVGYNFG